MAAVREDAFIVAAFPDRLAEIETLRRANNAFDEICMDFIEIAQVAAVIEPSKRSDDILESLSDLKKEIKSALSTSQNNNTINKDKTNEIT